MDRAISSVLAQTKQPDEIIVVNDGGNRPILNLSCSCLINVVNLPSNKGAAAARNIGATYGKGTFLAFLDDDDTWDPNYLKTCMGYAEFGKNLVLTAFMKVKEGQEPVPEKIPPGVLISEDWLVKNQGLRGSNLFIEKSLFKRVGGFDPALPSFHDIDFAIRLARIPDLRYQSHSEAMVFFHVHHQVRLSTAGSSENLAGLNGFFQKYANQMTRQHREAFVERAKTIWKVRFDQGYFH